MNFTNYDWWQTPEDEAYAAVQATVNQIDESQAGWHQKNIRFAKMYSFQDMLGFGQFRFAQASQTTNNTYITPRTTINVVKSIVDTAQAKIAKVKPKPMFLTEGGNYAQQKKAQSLTQYIEGVFYKESAYDKAKLVFKDAAVFGTGALKVLIDEETQEIKLERVFTDDLRIDYADGIYKQPKQMHQIFYVARSVLLAEYPEQASRILSAHTASDFDTNSVIDVIKVVESWHLPTKGKHGVHMISIDSCTLFYEDYKKDYFPFVFMRWSDALAGFFGIGVAEEVMSLQVSINQTLKNIQTSLDLVALPKVAIQNGSSIATNQLNNQIGAVIKYDGAPPIYFTPTAMNAEAYNHLKWLIEQAYRMSGVSELSAGSQKPAGLNSGVALTTYNEIETERFSIISQCYEQLFVDLTRIIIDFSEDLYKSNKKLKIKGSDGKFIKSIKWSEVRMQDDEYTTKVFPISSLPSTPAGKLEMVNTLVQMGIIPLEAAPQLLQFPDLESYFNLDLASQKVIEQDIYRMIDEGVYTPPEPEQNLKLSIKVAQNAFLKGRIDAVPELHLSLLLRYMQECNRLLNLKAPEVTEAPPPIQPIAQPEAAPVSDMLPFQPQGLPV